MGNCANIKKENKFKQNLINNKRIANIKIVKKTEEQLLLIMYNDLSNRSNTMKLTR